MEGKLKYYFRKIIKKVILIIKFIRILVYLIKIILVKIFIEVEKGKEKLKYFGGNREKKVRK